MTEDPNFYVVYLTQGAGEADKCTLSRKIVARRDLKNIERGDKKYDYWLSESEESN